MDVQLLAGVVLGRKKKTRDVYLVKEGKRGGGA